ncbi:hypothetical protein CYMTET_44163, partial [Cymbomonas tetramitiformis]
MLHYYADMLPNSEFYNNAAYKKKKLAKRKIKGDKKPRYRLRGRLKRWHALCEGVSPWFVQRYVTGCVVNTILASTLVYIFSTQYPDSPALDYLDGFFIIAFTIQTCLRLAIYLPLLAIDGKLHLTDFFGKPSGQLIFLDLLAVLPYYCHQHGIDVRTSEGL